MSKKMRFTIDIELQKTAGKFASKESVEEEIFNWLTDANQQTVEVEESEYEVVTWDVYLKGV